MPRTRPIKTNFTRGEIDPLAHMRSDTVPIQNGAERIRNALVFPQGGARRRDGLEFIDTLPPASAPVLPALPVARVAAIGNVRIIRFKFSLTQLYLMVLTVEVLYIYRDDILIFEQSHPFQEAEIPEVNWTSKDDTVLFFHPNHQTQKLQRQGVDSSWALTAFPYTNPPTLVFDNTALGTIKPSAVTGTGITLTFGTAQGGAADIGKYVRFNGGFAKITAFPDPTYTADVLSDFTNTDTIEQGFWTKEEEAFSSSKGWPVSGTFFQGRLCIAGTKTSPQLFATSRSGVIEDFFAGNADADSGIIILGDSEEVTTFNQIRVGRHLQIFGDDSEWYVPISESTAITPANSTIVKTSSVGSKPGIRTFEVDGVVYFLQRGGGALREFVFTDREKAYSSDPVSLLSSHLVRNPSDTALRKSLNTDDANYIWHVNSDGTMAAFCILRSEEVNAWSLLNTEGNFKNAAVLDQDSYFVVDRVIDSFNVKFIEKFNRSLKYDAGVIVSSGGPYTSVSGLTHLANATVGLTLDNAYQGEFTIDGTGSLTFPRSANTYQLGLQFPLVEGETKNRVLIRTLPADLLLPEGATMGKKKRIVDVAARVVDTETFLINGNRAPSRKFGSSLLDVPITPVDADIEIRGIRGYTRKGQIDISQELPFTLTILGMAYSIAT